MIPGINKKDISVDVEDNKLFIKHQLIEEQKEEEVNYLRFGFNKGSFNKEFKLSDKIDKANISATFENGIQNTIDWFVSNSDEKNISENLLGSTPWKKS